ncbi:MAG: ATP-binding protein [Clostridiales bacterium]|nr:ATP-binding protein [Clostridiales bacterium]
MYGVLILICYLCCEISFYDAVYCASLGYLTQHIASDLYIMLVYQGSIPEWNGIRYPAVYAIVYVLIFLIFSRRLQEGGQFGITWTNAAVTVVITLGIVLWISALVKGTTAEITGAESVTAEYIRLFCITQIYAMGICLIFLVTQLLHRNEMRAVRRLNQNQRVWEQRRLQYELSRENIDLMNRKCHDMKHQIAALAQTKNSSSREKDFVSNVQEMIEIYDSDIHTGNDALDTILMEKGLYCRLHGIEWTCVADGGLLSFMDQVDLYTIMGNVLDNATEAVEKCAPEVWRFINVRIWKRDLFAVVQIENSYTGTIEFENGLPKTSKENKEFHGFGMRSIKAMAEKYGGTIHMNGEKGVFTLTILLPLSEEI